MWAESYCYSLSKASAFESSRLHCLQSEQEVRGELRGVTQTDYDPWERPPTASGSR